MASGVEQQPRENNPVSDDSGAVKITYDIEDESKPSAPQRMKEKLAPSSTEEHNAQSPAEVAYNLAAAADAPEQTKLPLPSGLNIRQSAGGTQEIPGEEARGEKLKVSRGEELGTGYESDSETSGKSFKE